jgi:LCP family protein required for cell wall assembly
MRKTANKQRLEALGDEIEDNAGTRSERRRAAHKVRRRRRWRRGILIGLSVVLVLLLAATGYVYYITHNLRRQVVRGLSGQLARGEEAGTENILMAGSTSRCALTVQNPAYGLCRGSATSAPVNGVNSDVIMILHVDPARHRLSILSIPRDLFIPNARTTGAGKIDAALYQGLTQLVAAIEEDFGIPIQHAVSLNFDQFASVVDALGGINMSFPMSVFDAFSGLNVKAAPCVHLNGTQALQVVRARELRYDSPGTDATLAEFWPQEAQSDLARIRRDHEFLRVLATELAKTGLGDPIRDLNLINSVRNDFTFDQTWPVSDMVHLMLEFHSINVNSVPQLTLPVAVVSDPEGIGGALVYKGYSYGDVEFPAASPDQAAIDQFLAVGPTTDSMTGRTLPSPASIAVSVLNGTGAYNQAADTAFSLGALGFHVTGVGDSPPVGDETETVVYYGSRSSSVEAAAEEVVHSLTGSVVMAYNPSGVVDGADITVVTGNQFAVIAPSTPTTAPAAGSSTPTTTPTAAPTVAAIAPPSPSTSNLAPWDPRACPVQAPVTAPVANPT